MANTSTSSRTAFVSGAVVLAILAGALTLNVVTRAHAPVATPMDAGITYPSDIAQDRGSP